MALDEQTIANVYGETYKRALEQMEALEQRVQLCKGFDSEEACAKWAAENNLDFIVYSQSGKISLNVTHQGLIYIKSHWKNKYCDVLCHPNDEGKIVAWAPRGYKGTSKERVAGESSVMGKLPLYHRDYYTPMNYFDPIRGTFNVAKPIPVFAANTGADTTLIYKYLEHVATECYWHLLAWLRKKVLYPAQKTEIVPIIVSRVQGNGKTTFAEVICKALFGKDNVLVTSQLDISSRFNADYADALIVCQEEREEADRRNTVAALKSMVTSTTVRKEKKGQDPYYQDSFTDFIVTTNQDVPIKFDNPEAQRRFMVMEADPNFLRDSNDLAEQVFTKLYGIDKAGNKVGVPFTQDNNLIAQLKHELVTREDIANVDLRNFPHTNAYQRCLNLPRTNEAVEIESIVKSIAPFIQASLMQRKLITEVVLEGSDEVLTLGNYVSVSGAMQYVPEVSTYPQLVAICRPIVFFDSQTNKPMKHSVVERGLLDCECWLRTEHGIQLLHDSSSLPGGFYKIASKDRNGAAARFMLIEDYRRLKDKAVKVGKPNPAVKEPEQRIGERLRVNGQWKPDPNGEFETVNEMKPGTTTLANKGSNVQYMDNFLFECDEIDKSIYEVEQARLIKLKAGGAPEIDIKKVYIERLQVQLAEATRLYNAGIAWRIVYSGNKSYHILVRIKDSPTTLEEYKWLHAHLCGTLSTKLTFDSLTSDPARLTRAPVTRKREIDDKLFGVQELVYENKNNVYDYRWRAVYNEWLNRPLTDYEQAKGRRLVPTKPEYLSAMYALLNGTFWIDTDWNNKRQRCFFPGYRLCRMLGYSHDELWADGGILDGLEKYYKRSEIEYWKTREKSDIIRQIDRDIDKMEEENEGNR